MKKLLASLLALAFCGAVHAQAELLETKNCLLCHSIEKRIVGPAYKEVAAKYKGDEEAPAKLARKIMQGGSGVWGKTAMPANPQVSAEEAKALANYILSRK